MFVQSPRQAGARSHYRVCRLSGASRGSRASLLAKLLGSEGPAPPPPRSLSTPELCTTCERTSLKSDSFERELAPSRGRHDCRRQIGCVVAASPPPPTGLPPAFADPLEPCCWVCRRVCLCVCDVCVCRRSLLSLRLSPSLPSLPPPPHLLLLLRILLLSPRRTSHASLSPFNRDTEAQIAACTASQPRHHTHGHSPPIAPSRRNLGGPPRPTARFRPRCRPSPPRTSEHCAASLRQSRPADTPPNTLLPKWSTSSRARRTTSRSRSSKTPSSSTRPQLAPRPRQARRKSLSTSNRRTTRSSAAKSPSSAPRRARRAGSASTSSGA